MAHGVILFAHGARAASWALPFEKLRERVAAMHPGAHVRLAFLELMQPDLGSVVDDLTNESVERIDLFPIFLAVGSHLREDLPQLVSAAQARHPGLHITVHPALGESEAMLAAIAGGIGQALAAS
ncbi:MAG: cobalamin biosynthesis protein CbiX [Betaproteobacteria bacterium]|jgi:sirohydrochlorin cobaltochelatase|nr:cobalamin biosynthesis protein CbiX [Betaproteobacteria bacterium]NCU85627.1 cobalamin biosynthesis protein CbiX [Betaproteobacteria bacterium]NCU95019.1 cobalamin biosynthesis protein CbiX [Betaproteobacteria bacterium]NDF70357.1 cobalamin biosynthesis protein CbiX [Betaproteobacteria bacterium]